MARHSSHILSKTDANRRRGPNFRENCVMRPGHSFYLTRIEMSSGEISTLNAKIEETRTAMSGLMRSLLVQIGSLNDRIIKLERVKQRSRSGQSRRRRRVRKY